MTNVRIKDVVVTSDDPDAREDEARAIATVFSKYWLEGASQDEIIESIIERDDGTEVVYQIEYKPLS